MGPIPRIKFVLSIILFAICFCLAVQDAKADGLFGRRQVFRQRVVVQQPRRQQVVLRQHFVQTPIVAPFVVPQAFIAPPQQIIVQQPPAAIVVPQPSASIVVPQSFSVQSFRAY